MRCEGFPEIHENRRKAIRVVYAGASADSTMTARSISALALARPQIPLPAEIRTKELSVAWTRLALRISCLLTLTVCVRAAWSVQPAEALLPATTKGFISTHDVDEVRTKFNETQLGEMVNDPVMRPFVDDVKKQIGAKLERAGKKLGVKWEDLEGVYGGEVCLALV